MSARLQSKRATFAGQAKRKRKAEAIIRKFGAEPGFLGAVSNIRINGKGFSGTGALYMLSKRGAH